MIAFLRSFVVGMHWQEVTIVPPVLNSLKYKLNRKVPRTHLHVKEDQGFTIKEQTGE